METLRQSGSSELAATIQCYVNLYLDGAQLTPDEGGQQLLARYDSGAELTGKNLSQFTQCKNELSNIARDVGEKLKQTTIEHHMVDGRDVYIVDGLLSAEEAEQYHQSISVLQYRLHEHDFSGDQYPIFSTEFAKKRFLGETALSLRILTIMRQLFPAEAFRLNRAYINLSRYGDMEYPHRDCSESGKDLTALFYAVDDWKPEFGGETLFYQPQGDTALAVSPRPGRLVLFRGAILHLGGVPTRICSSARYSLALKFGCRPVFR